MHSVCPQIRPTAFNRLDASSCLASLDKLLKPLPSHAIMVPFALPFPFLSFVGWGATSKKRLMHGVGAGIGGKRGYDSICAVCGPPRLGASCVHLTPNVAWGPWLTDGLSHLLQILVKDLHKNTHGWIISSLFLFFLLCLYFLYELWWWWKKYLDRCVSTGIFYM